MRGRNLRLIIWYLQGGQLSLRITKNRNMALHDTDCPEYHKAIDGMCIPIAISFREWVLETKVGLIIPEKSSDPITYDEFMRTVRETVCNPVMMRALRETYCNQFESPLERGKPYQEEFNRRMERYNGN